MKDYISLEDWDKYFTSETQIRNKPKATIKIKPAKVYAWEPWSVKK